MTLKTSEKSDCDLAVLDIFYGLLLKYFPKFQRKVLLQAMKMQDQYADLIQKFLRHEFEIPGRAPFILTRTFLEIPIECDIVRLKHDFPDVFEGIIADETLFGGVIPTNQIELVAIPKSNMGPAKRIPFSDVVEYYTDHRKMGFELVPFSAAFAVFRAYRGGLSGNKMIAPKNLNKYKGARLYFASDVRIPLIDGGSGILSIAVGDDGSILAPQLDHLEGLTFDGKKQYVVFRKPQLAPLNGCVSRCEFPE